MNAKTANNTQERVAQQLYEKLYLAAKKSIESARKKAIGEPYEGELHVRFDEGMLVAWLPNCPGMGIVG
ncbi:MAG: hypothetical protein ACE5J5_04565 [Candidatus Hydrothermarchaeales archaeon]